MYSAELNHLFLTHVCGFDGPVLNEVRLYLRTPDGDMSIFLGVNCVRSSPSPSLAATLLRSHAQAQAQAQAHLACVGFSTTILQPLAGSGRFLTTWPSPRRHDKQPRHASLGWLPHRPQGSPPSRLGPQRRTLFGRAPVCVHYVHLPPEYKDEVGLAFQQDDKDLDRITSLSAFPSCANMTTSRATRLLKIMHGRRVAGTLDDPSLRVNTADFTDLEIKLALKYLRTAIPVDEVLNAGLRAEDELRELEAGITPEAGDGERTPAEETDQDDPSTTTTNNNNKTEDYGRRSFYGEGVLDRIRATNIARREAEERAEAEQRRREEEAAAQNWGELTTTATPYDPALHRGLHPKQLEHYEAATSGLEAPPDVPRWRVLLPTVAFAAAVLVALYLVVDKVAPPRPARELPTAPRWGGGGGGGVTEAHVVVGAVLLLNAAVFVAWRRVRLWKFLNRHFILDFVTPRPHQVLTAMASHQEAKHLLTTMFLAAAGGSLLGGEVGPGALLATYVASGVCGFLATLATQVARGNALVYMFGASSAGFGTLCAYFWLYRFDGFKILGLPPDPYQGMQGLGIIGLLMAFYAIVPMVRRQGGGVDWMSHLGGMLAGIGCAALMEGRWKEAKAKLRLDEAGPFFVEPVEDTEVPTGGKRSF